MRDVPQLRQTQAQDQPYALGHKLRTSLDGFVSTMQPYAPGLKLLSVGLISVTYRLRLRLRHRLGVDEDSLVTCSSTSRVRGEGEGWCHRAFVGDMLLDLTSLKLPSTSERARHLQGKG